MVLIVAGMVRMAGGLLRFGMGVLLLPGRVMVAYVGNLV
jgi:hypothetical protein